MEQKAVEPQEYKSDELTVVVHQKPSCVVELHAHASPSMALTAYDKAVKAVIKEVSIPGFRKGKAPKEMVAKKFAKEIDREWQQELANLAFVESKKLIAIPVLDKDSKINFNIKSHSLEKGAELTFSFETEPRIPSVDPKKFHLKPVARPPVTDEQVEETIRQISFFFATWESIIDRPAQEGDFVILDVDVLEIDPPATLFSNTRFEVSDKSMAKWMKSLVIGLSEGATAEGISQPDEDAPAETKEAFPPKKVRISVKKIEKAVLPPIDENFFKLLGVSSLEELRTSLHNLLNRKADAHVQEEHRKQTVDFLLHQHPFDLPHSFIVKETRFRMQQLLADQEFMQQWSRMGEAEQQKMIKTVFDQSEKAVRLFYVCRKIVHDAKIHLTPADLPKPPTTPLEILINPPADYHLHPEEDLREAEAYSKLVLEKAEDYLIAHAGHQAEGT